MWTLEEAIEYAERMHKENRNGLQYALKRGETKFAEKYSQLAAWLRELQRARVLLKATHDLLEAADDSPYVEDVLAILVHYDDTDCDGSCLMEDIEYYFEEFGEERRTDG